MGTLDQLVSAYPGKLRLVFRHLPLSMHAESKIAALDLAAHYDELSVAGRGVLSPEFAGFGLELSRFFIENISLPEEVEKAIDQRSKLGVLCAFPALSAVKHGSFLRHDHLHLPCRGTKRPYP